MHEDKNIHLSERDEAFLSGFDRLGYALPHGNHNFNIISENFRVHVDGVPWHYRQEKYPNNCEFELDVNLLPRQPPFYKICHRLSTTLFTNRGSPRVASLKKAMEVNDNKNPIFLINACFKMLVECRSTSSTVGPLLTRELLQVFHDEHSVAICIPNDRSQLTEEEIMSERMVIEMQTFSLK